MRRLFCLQTIQKVLVAYAELVQRDFSQFTSKHDVVSIRCFYKLQYSVTTFSCLAKAIASEVLF